MPPGRKPYFGVVANGSTGALIRPDLTLAWLCVPRFDGPPVFASALDPQRGGSLSLNLREREDRALPLEAAGQSYLEDSGVLVTRAVCGPLDVSCHDVMPWGGDALVREVTVANRGATPWEGVLLVQAHPVESRHLPVRLEAAADGMGVEVSLAGGTPPAAGAVWIGAWPRAAATGELGLRLDVGPLPPGGEFRAAVVVGYGRDVAEARGAAQRTQTALEAPGGQSLAAAEAAAWRQWLRSGRLAGLPGAARSVSSMGLSAESSFAVPFDPLAELPPEWRRAYVRSLVVTRQLLHTGTGGIVAALTASLPAVPGGGDNWDYRYVWLRDGAYGAMALDEAGFGHEAAAFYRWALARQEEDGHWRQPLYTLDGQDPQEILVTDLTGPGGERPVRLGNAASGQLQLDNEGNILYGLWHHYEQSGDLELLSFAWNHVRRAADWIAAHWDRKESGIWEIRGSLEHWVHGKALCYAALVAAARIGEALGQIADVPRWREIAGAIRRQVLQEGWDPERQAYARTYDHGSPMDISALSLVFYGLLPPDDPRVRSTVRQMKKATAHGGLVMAGGVARYDYARLPFYLPTLWLAQYYLLDGQEEDADRLIDLCLGCSTDLLLMAEHFDPVTGEQWGNFPQLFSHEEVVRTLLLRQRLRREGLLREGRRATGGRRGAAGAQSREARA